MKKIFTAIIICGLILSFTACSEINIPDKSSSKTEASATSQGEQTTGFCYISRRTNNGRRKSAAKRKCFGTDGQHRDLY